MCLNIFVIAYVVLSNATATILLKKGSDYFSGQSIFCMDTYYRGGMGWVFIAFSVVFYLTSLLISVIAYSRMEVSFFTAFMSLTFILAALGGWFFFGEDISICRMVGISIIVVGVVIVAYS